MIKQILLGPKVDQAKAAQKLHWQNTRRRTMAVYYYSEMFCGYGHIERKHSYQPFERGYIRSAPEETHHHSYPGPWASHYFACKYAASREDCDGEDYREIFSQTTSCRGIDGNLWDLDTPEIKALNLQFRD